MGNFGYFLGQLTKAQQAREEQTFQQDRALADEALRRAMNEQQVAALRQSTEQAGKLAPLQLQEATNRITALEAELARYRELTPPAVEEAKGRAALSTTTAKKAERFLPLEEDVLKGQIGQQLAFTQKQYADIASQQIDNMGKWFSMLPTMEVNTPDKAQAVAEQSGLSPTLIQIFANPKLDAKGKLAYAQAVAAIFSDVSRDTAITSLPDQQRWASIATRLEQTGLFDKRQSLDIARTFGRAVADPNVVLQTGAQRAMNVEDITSRERIARLQEETQKWVTMQNVGLQKELAGLDFKYKLQLQFFDSLLTQNKKGAGNISPEAYDKAHDNVLEAWAKLRPEHNAMGEELPRDRATIAFNQKKIADNLALTMGLPPEMTLLLIQNDPDLSKWASAEYTLRQNGVSLPVIQAYGQLFHMMKSAGAQLGGEGLLGLAPGTVEMPEIVGTNIPPWSPGFGELRTGELRTLPPVTKGGKAVPPPPGKVVGKEKMQIPAKFTPQDRDKAMFAQIQAKIKQKKSLTPEESKLLRKWLMEK